MRLAAFSIDIVCIYQNDLHERSKQGACIGKI